MEVATSHGPARVVAEGEPGEAAFLLALTHGAGGDVNAPDLLAVRDAALALGGLVVRITQPYRVRGARTPGPAQDAAWLEVVGALRRAAGARLPLVQGGRSNGARVACRTAEAAGALAVIALAFPLHPPGRPEKSRAAELRMTGRKVLVVSGERDPFGVPGRARGRRVVVLAGEGHALSRHPRAAGAAVTAWLPGVLRQARGAGPRGVPGVGPPGRTRRAGW